MSSLQWTCFATYSQMMNTEGTQTLAQGCYREGEHDLNIVAALAWLQLPCDSDCIEMSHCS